MYWFERCFMRPIMVLLAITMLVGCSDREAMVSTANPHASQAALEILQAGGSAVDAAIAAQMVLTLTEPQSSGIGGGAYMMLWDQSQAKVLAYDGREIAPAAAGPKMFFNPDDTPMTWQQASMGGLPVGVPGVIAMLSLAHEHYGKLEWRQLFQPAIELAENGYEVSPRLAAALQKSAAKLQEDKGAGEIYFTHDQSTGENRVLRQGETLVNQPLANSLRLIANKGADAFYQGPIARQIMLAVRNAKTNPSTMSLSDLAGYQAKLRQAVCAPYREYKVCGMPPSSSGGITSLMILGILNQFDLKNLDPNGPETAHLFAEASALAFADRNLYLGDSDFISIPSGLLDKAYLQSRARLIDQNHSMGKAKAGSPSQQIEAIYAPDESVYEFGTSHFAVVDQWGNAISMTSSVEKSFGSHITAGGFVLNSQLTDFSFVPVKKGKPVANAPAALKRPRSSMSPSLIFNLDGSFFAAIGSPGGPRIIDYTARTITGLVDWQMDMQSAIDLPHVSNRNRRATELEENTPVAEIAAALTALGHKPKVTPLTSGLHGIRRVDGVLDGGADKRREGVVLSTD